MAKTVQLSPTHKHLYLSKATNYQECPRLGYLAYESKLRPKRRIKPLYLGRLFHKMNQKYVDERSLASPIISLNKEEDLEEDTKSLLLLMFDNFSHVLFLDEGKFFIMKSTEQDKKGNFLSRERESIEILTTEQTLGKEMGEYMWYIRTDLMFLQQNQTWVGEYKSTAGYGAATAKFYHNSPQTWTYLRILAEHFPQLRGTKFFIVTKTKDPKVHIEEVLITKDKFRFAEIALEESVNMMREIERLGTYPRAMTKCLSSKKECPYLNLCYIYNPLKKDVEPGVRATYLDEVMELYETYDPEEHLLDMED